MLWICFAGGILTGLGDSKNLYTGKCGHSHSSPLKFLLPNLSTKSNEVVVIDSVAGVDMLSYGLFMGVDVVISIVEPAKNSIKIANQIKEYCKEVNLPITFIINKHFENEIITKFISKNKEKVLGKVSLDPIIASYDFDKLSSEIYNELSNIVINISDHYSNLPKINQWERLVEFEKQKESMRKYFANKK